MENRAMENRGLDVLDIIFKNLFLRSARNRVIWEDAGEGWYTTRSGSSTAWISCDQFKIVTIAHGKTYQEKQDFDTTSDMYGLFQIVATTLFGENPQTTLLHDFSAYRAMENRSPDVVDAIFKHLFLESARNGVTWADAGDGWYSTKSGSSTAWISCDQFKIATVAHGRTYQEKRDFDTTSDMYGLFQIVATTLFGDNPQTTLLHDFPA